MPNTVSVRVAVAVVVGASFIACTSLTDVECRPSPQYTPRPASAAAPRSLERAPADAIDLGLIQAVGNAFTSAGDCELALLEKAREIGADAFVRRQTESGASYRSPTGYGRAYALPE